MAKDIQRNIILNATSRGFGEVGNTLMEMGAMLDGLTSKIVNFGKDSVEVYKDYEFNMNQARIALSTKYGQGTKELDEQMAKLDQHAKEWAKDNIFHTNDVSNAIMLASRAGMNANEIIAAMPHLMALAQAGGIDLSEGIDMAIKSVRALGYSMETDLGDFVDQWVYAANSSTGSVEQFGETFMALGAVGRFTESKEELLALTALMHNFGITGSAAATAMRTAIMRIIAPSGIASKTLKLLGASEEDVKGIMEDKALLGVLNELEDLGFKAYTAEGQLKPIMTIFQELDQAMSGANWNEEKRINSLRTLFGMRGVVGASNIMEGMAGAIQLFDALNSGDAEGYGLYAQAVMMDTLYGDTEILASKWEELKRRTGETLSPKLRETQEALGGIVDAFNGLDQGHFDALVTGLTTLAGLSGGLTLTGMAFSFISKFLTPTGAIAMTLAAVVAAAEAFKELEEKHFEDAFGLGELDNKAIMDNVNGMAEEFTAAYAEVDKFRTSVSAAKTEYEEASKTFSSNLLTSVITGNVMTPEQQSELEGLGMSMYMAVQKGLTDSKNASTAYWKMLLDGSEPTDAQTMETIEKLMTAGYEDTLNEAAKVNQGIHDALMKGFRDGFTQEDYDLIQQYMSQYNEMVASAAAQAKDKQDYIEQQKLLHKAQTAQLSDIQKTAEEISAARDQAIADENDRYLEQMFGLEWAYEHQSFVDGKKVDETTYNAMRAEIEERHQQRQMGFAEQYDGMLWRLWETQITQGDMADEYNRLMNYAMSVLSGEMTMNQAIGQFGGNSERINNMSRLLAYRIANYGGYEGLEARIRDYTSKGQYEQADTLRLLYTMQQINDNYNRTQVGGWPGILALLRGSDLPAVTGGDEYSPDNIAGFKNVVGLTDAQAILEAANNYNTLRASLHDLQQDYSRLQNWGVNDADVLANRETWILQTTRAVEAAKSELDRLVQNYADNFGLDFLQNNESIPLDVVTNLNTQAVDSYMPPNKSALVYYTPVTMGGGNQSAAGRGGETVYMFAEGGRTTAPSIFGEGGIPEWAIPEEHSDRTAELLNAARAASGFSWPEILSRFGGLNADVNHTPTTIVYSPTINANDVSGVREALSEDKRRLERWFADRKLRNEIEVYA